MFKQTKWNFEAIKNTVQACELLQDAGKSEDVDRMMKEFAQDVMKTVKDHKDVTK